MLSLHIDEGSGMIDQARLTDSLPEILWFASIFGENSSHIVTQLIEAETALQTDRDIFIERGNAEINNLSDYETSLLNFVMQHGYREEEASQDDNPNSVARAEDLEPQEVAERLIDYTTGRPTGEKVDMSQSFPQFVELIEELAEHEPLVQEKALLLITDDTAAMIDRIAQEANDRDRELGFVIRGVHLMQDPGDKRYLIGGYVAPAMDFATAKRGTTTTDPEFELANATALTQNTQLTEYLEGKAGIDVGKLVLVGHIHQEGLGKHWHTEPSQQDYEQVEQTLRERGGSYPWAVVTKADGQLGMRVFYSYLRDGEVQHDEIPFTTESGIYQMLQQGQRDAA